VAVGRVNGVAGLTGSSYDKMYGQFAGTQKIRRNNEVTVLTGRGSTGINLIRREGVTLLFSVLIRDRLIAASVTTHSHE